MEERLSERHCVPCEGHVPPLDRQQIDSLLQQVPGWAISTESGHGRLVRTFAFPDFITAVDFVNRIAAVAEREGHHPDLLVSWGRVEVQLWTHAAGGLTENDFILAAKINSLSSN